MKLNVIYTIGEPDSTCDPPKIGMFQEMKKHRKEFWQFLKDNKIEPTLYERTLGNYEDWLKYEAT